MSSRAAWMTGLLSLGTVACGEGGNLAISAGAPVLAAVTGTVTDCGKPVAAAQVSLRVQQNTSEQARPVDARVGPVTTDRQGRYLIELGPPFAVPGPADLEVRVAAAGISIEVRGELKFSIGPTARDTVRLDADLAVRRGFCIVMAPGTAGELPPAQTLRAGGPRFQVALVELH